MISKLFQKTEGGREYFLIYSMRAGLSDTTTKKNTLQEYKTADQ